MHTSDSAWCPDPSEPGVQASWGCNREGVVGIERGDPLTPSSAAGCLPVFQASEPFETAKVKVLHNLVFQEVEPQVPRYASWKQTQRGARRSTYIVSFNPHSSSAVYHLTFQMRSLQLGGGQFPGSGYTPERKEPRSTRRSASSSPLPASLLAVLTQDPTITAKSSLLMVLDTVGASPTLTLTSMSNGQELDIVTQSYIHCGEQHGLPGALSLPGMLWVVGVLSYGAVIQVEYQIHFLL